MRIEGEYVLVLKWGEKNQSVHHIPSGTPEEAAEKARAYTRQLQSELVNEMPFSPQFVTGEVYQRIHTIDGAELVKELEKKAIEQAWKCYNNSCLYIGNREEFVQGENGRKCPKCGEDGCTFPYRMYKCKKCGKVADQNAWFPEESLDDDPLEEKLEAGPCEGCVEKFESDEFGKNLSIEETEQHWEELANLSHQPAELEEIPVEFPVT